VLRPGFCKGCFFALVLLWGQGIAADFRSPESRCRAVPYHGSPIDGAIYDLCVSMLRSSERTNLQAQHRGMPLKFGDPRQHLKDGQICIAGTVTELGISEGVPFARQVLEDYRPLACEADHRL